MKHYSFLTDINCRLGIGGESYRERVRKAWLEVS